MNARENKNLEVMDQLSPRSVASKSVTEWDEVVEFLTCISLEKYAETLRNEGFDRFEALYELREEDLKEMCIPKGHIRILIKKLQSHQMQSEIKSNHNRELSFVSDITMTRVEKNSPRRTHSKNGRSRAFLRSPSPPMPAALSCSPRQSFAPSRSSNISYLPSLPTVPLGRHSSFQKYSTTTTSVRTNVAVAAPRNNLSLLSLPANVPSLMSLPPLADLKSHTTSIPDQDFHNHNNNNNNNNNEINDNVSSIDEEENSKMQLQEEVEKLIEKVKASYKEEKYLNDNASWDDIHDMIHKQCDKWCNCIITTNNNAAVIVLTLFHTIVTNKQSDHVIQCIVYELMAIVHAKIKNTTQASHYFELSLKINPTYIQALHDWAYLVFYELLGKHTDLSTRQQAISKAIELYKQCIKLNSKYSYVYNHYGNIYEDEGLLKEACEWYRKALWLRSDVSNYHLDLANTLDDLGDRKTAEKHYLKAIELDGSGEAVYHWNYGIFLEHEKRYNEATTAYQVAIQLNPQCIDAYLNIANMFEQRGYEQINKQNKNKEQEEHIDNENGYLREALGYYGKVLQLTGFEKHDPSIIQIYGQALYKCANIYQDLNCLVEAEQCYQICLARFPQQWQLYVRLATVLYFLGRTVDCNAVFQKGLRIIHNEEENKKLTEEYVKWLKVLNEDEKEKKKTTPRTRPPVDTHKHTHSIQTTQSVSELNLVDSKDEKSVIQKQSKRWWFW